jgi:hypothetical protein
MAKSIIVLALEEKVAKTSHDSSKYSLGANLVYGYKGHFKVPQSKERLLGQSVCG